MAKLELEITDDLKQVLEHLEALDGQTPDQRYAKYHADIVQNEAKVDLSRPERAVHRLAELAEDAAEAKQKRRAAKKAEAEARALDPVVSEGSASELPVAKA